MACADPRRACRDAGLVRRGGAILRPFRRPVRRSDRRPPGQAARVQRAQLDRGTAIHIAGHLQRACRHLAGFVEDYRPRLKPDQLAKLTALTDRIRASALEPIYRAHPGLRGLDLTERRAPRAQKIARASAVRLQDALKDVQTRIPDAFAAFYALASTQDIQALAERIAGVLSEFGAASQPIYRRFPDLWDREVKTVLLMASPRTDESDASFRKSAPPPGTARLSPRALSWVGEFLAAVRKAGGRDEVASIGWAEEVSTKGPDDTQWRRSGPGLGLGSYGRRQLPPDVIETIGGLPFVFSAPNPAIFTGKTIDYQDGRLVLVPD